MTRSSRSSTSGCGCAGSAFLYSVRAGTSLAPAQRARRRRLDERAARPLGGPVVVRLGDRDTQRRRACAASSVGSSSTGSRPHLRPNRNRLRPVRSPRSTRRLIGIELDDFVRAVAEATGRPRSMASRPPRGRGDLGGSPSLANAGTPVRVADVADGALSSAQHSYRRARSGCDPTEGSRFHMSESRPVSARLRRSSRCALVVRDLDEAVRRWSRDARHRAVDRIPARADATRRRCAITGRKVDFSFRHAFAWQGELQFELIQPLAGPSIFADHLETRGEGLHHLGKFVDDHAAGGGRSARARVHCRSRALAAMGRRATARSPTSSPPGIAPDRRADRSTDGSDRSRSSSTLRSAEPQGA